MNRPLQITLVAMFAIAVAVFGAVILSGQFGATQAGAPDAPEATEVESALRVPAPENGQAKVIFEQVGMT